jgi:hypothetical protein
VHSESGQGGNAMSWVQSFFKAVLPRNWAESMEAESRAWKMRCPCGFERSVWDVGGIRWKAAGNPTRLLRCRQCGQRTWHHVHKEAAA